MTFIRGYGLKANTKKQLLTLLIYGIKTFFADRPEIPDQAVQLPRDKPGTKRS